VIKPARTDLNLTG